MSDRDIWIPGLPKGALVGFLLALGVGAGGSSVAAEQQAVSRIDRDGIPRVISGISEGASGSTPQEAALAYLRSRGAKLRLDEISLDIDGAELMVSPGGVRIAIQQTLGDIPVFRGGILIGARPDNEIRMLVNDLVYGLDLRSARVELTAREALSVAHHHLSASGSPITPPSSTLFVYRSPLGTDHLAYRITSTLTQPYGDWEIFVDATSGEVLSVRDQFVHAQASQYVQGQGAIYRSDPLSEVGGRYGDPGLTDNDDADSDPLNAARTIVALDSLRLQDGLVELSGPFCTVTDIEAPADPVAFSQASPDAFRFTRSQPGFEAVMVYYHATLAYRRLQELGLEIPRLRTLRLDPHGYNGQDNSHYSPSGNWISFGTGGVDDAEDADVIWHEYGHAIVYCLIPYWGGGEAGALGEGYSDYWAASHGRSLGHWEPHEPAYQWLFKWDGHNPFWPGRILNASGTYPFGALGIHAAGQIWASALMGIHDDLGRDITDRLVLSSLFYLGASPTAQDAALAILQADRDLYAGAHQATLVYWLGTVKNFLPDDRATRILVIADDGVVPADSLRVGLTEQPPAVAVQPAYRQFSGVMNSLSIPQGYTIQTTTFGTFDTSSLAGSPLVVLMGGLNPQPFDDAQKRAAIVRYARGGGRLLVEGGEVGFVYSAREGNEIDEEFRREALHCGAHAGDAPGAEFRPDGSVPTLFSTPHRIATSVSFSEPSSFAQRDVLQPESSDPSTTQVGTWSVGGAGGGMLLHRSSGGGASLLVPFSLAALQDSLQACCLMENLITFMLLPTFPTSAAAEDPEGVPADCNLWQNYPNPFNPATTIRFELGGRTSQYDVIVEIFDGLGRRIATPLRATLPSGVHELHFDATGLPSGVYFYRLSTAVGSGADPVRLMRRMLLVR